MALRLIQIKLPASAEDSLQDFFAGQKFVNTWLAREDGNRFMVQLIAPAEACEAVMDDFDRRFHNAHGFHMLLPLLAFCPRANNRKGVHDGHG